MSLALVSCSDQSSEQSIYLPKDLHSSKREIAITAEYDAQVQEDSATGWLMGEKLFQAETELLIRGEQSGPASNIVPTKLPSSRKAFFGDLHVHTAYSLDGYPVGTLATPYDAYRYAKGEPILHPAGFEMQLSRPLDFYAVTDHAMFLGVVQAAADTTTEFSKNEVAQPLHDLNAAENMNASTFGLVRRFWAFASFIPDSIRQITEGQLDPNEVLEVVRTAWIDTIEAADSFNDPGNFTTFVGYEYTSSTVDSGNLHRNVIFEGQTDCLASHFPAFIRLILRIFGSGWMNSGIRRESRAIPHNSNGSNGQMFKLEDWAGSPLDDDYAKQRMRNEPIVEITQIKGTSETHPALSTRDEWAGLKLCLFELGLML